MKRSISGYHRDEAGDWVAELCCGHGLHLRHQPPFQLRAWVLESEGRSAMLGREADCAPCDRAELPGGLRPVRSSPEWDQDTMPAGLRREHRLASGTWGRIIVRQGQLRMTARTSPELSLLVGPEASQAIPPGVEHEVLPLGPVRFLIEFLAVERSGDPEVGQAGEQNNRRGGGSAPTD